MRSQEPIQILKLSAKLLKLEQQHRSELGTENKFCTTKKLKQEIVSLLVISIAKQESSILAYQDAQNAITEEF